jgi:hypothetical protein
MQEYIEAELPGLHSLLIVRYGYLAFEAYYQGFHQNSYNDVASVTKSLVSLLIGIALGEKKLTSVDQPMLEFFPEWADQEGDPRKQAVALRHLLSLTGGFSPEFLHKYWLNPVQLAVARPMVHQPGEMFFYDSQGVDILSGILTRVTGMSAAAYADATLFAELGIWRQANSRFTWKTILKALTPGIAMLVGMNNMAISGNVIPRATARARLVLIHGFCSLKRKENNSAKSFSHIQCHREKSLSLVERDGKLP